ncbi:dihydroxyacetone kinase subunit DhaK [Georgenia faecalis]|uniref:Dihydroxyacetone kinase subunit DhaK n=1 Tax=Georgenia faecalis TaxID=2483799 RepID=A0ABV9DE37_9MICO|nr:dihydroxyacetone kinase subunit DhaK [Georgenia faecalis]
MKKLVNDPRDAVAQFARAFARAHADLVTLHEDPLFLARPAEAGQVAVVASGGSGHEPLHVGFVGPGMLAAAVPGPLFSAPPPDAVLAATRAVDGGAGVLHVVPNYTGDVLTVALATEQAPGLDVRTVVVADDVAIPDPATRRGVAGTVLVERIAGAAAARGDDLDAVTAVARRAAAAVASMGATLRPGTAPHARPLGDDEVELGVGIHGEPGRERVAYAGADRLTDLLLDPVVAALGLRAGEEALLLVNGLGATPLAELYIVYGRARDRLEAHGVRVVRSLVGDFATSIDTAGASVSVLRLDEDLLRLWDAPVRTAVLRWGG